MRGVKGKLLKKLKSIRPIGYLKPDRVLQVSASDGFVHSSSMESNFNVQSQLVIEEEEPKKLHQSSFKVQEPEVIDVLELMRDLEDEEMEFDDHDKENTRPKTNMPNVKIPVDSKNDSANSSSLKENSEASRLSDSRAGENKQTPLSEIDVSSFRRPVLNSGSLFDPNLLAAFEQAVREIRALEAERRAIKEKQIQESMEEGPPLKARRIDDDTEGHYPVWDPLIEEEEETSPNPLLDFEEKCPPGGSDLVILYTTGLRGIRKTFEDCHGIRFLLESFRVLFYERDVSMHLEFREELWRTLGEKVVPPRLFIKGRYIGGAEEVLTLHEQGRLRPLFEAVPIDRSDGPCDGCAGVRFIMCFNCNGSQKLGPNDDGVCEKCPDCNENGLVICPFCC
ncbi:uncharacterized protein At3g28850-like [Cornus florida]|uniref:uncharacterized protein At3g28850-like n=1 Tax=Cornus florida TaxID=4283 RepID=UPI00289D27FC|nr:uncharacterized protein At3g28850-like [Cornus florida]